MKASDSYRQEAYTAEAKERWGNTDAYREHTEKTRGYSKDKWLGLSEAMDGIFAGFALCMKSGAAPDSAEALSLVKRPCGISARKVWKTGYLI